jgi:hypothetical protein
VLHGLLCLGFSSAYLSAVLKTFRGATYCGQKRERREKLQYSVNWFYKEKKKVKKEKREKHQKQKSEKRPKHISHWLH